jgi:DNA-binding MarR family transcriptional regulator
MRVNDCIFFQLTKASLASTAFWSKKIEPLGITASQAMVVNFLGEEDQISPHTLRQKLKITSATMTGILDRLENIGLIQRQQHPDDRRAILICLTDKGVRYAKDVNQIMLSANDEFLKKFDPKDLKIFRRMLKQLRGETQIERMNG